MSSRWSNYGPAPPGTGDLSPLGSQLQSGLLAIGSLAVISLMLSSSLFLFITYRLIEGRFRRRTHCELTSPPTRRFSPSSCPFDCGADDNGTFGLESSKSTTQRSSSPSQAGHSLSGEESRAAIPNIRERYKGYHPLLVLIYMLLISDIIQSMSMIPNLIWVTQDAITVRSGSCWAQGWLRSQGDVASSMFAATVSVNTWLMVVKRYTIPSKLLWTIVASIWSFSFIIVAAGVWASDNGTGHGGYFVRVDTWCWISSEYAQTRLWTHFCWVLAAFGIIFLSYMATVIELRPDPRWGRVLRLRNPRTTGHHPAFMIYPFVYFICCAPMAVGPMVLLAGVTISGEYFMFAGAMIASNGLVEVIVWSCTMVFLAPKDIKKAGLEDFQFMRTDSVKYGNIVWVEGGRAESCAREQKPWSAQCLSLPSLPNMSRAMPGRQRPNPFKVKRDSTKTEDGLLDAIQIETSTTVVVENDRGSKWNRRVSDIVSVPNRVVHRF